MYKMGLTSTKTCSESSPWIITLLPAAPVPSGLCPASQLSWQQSLVTVPMVVLCKGHRDLLGMGWGLQEHCHPHNL